MKVSVRVRANAKEERMEELGENSFVIRVKEKPVEDRANLAVTALLAGHFGVPKSRVSLVLGRRSKNKVFEVSDYDSR